MTRTLVPTAQLAFDGDGAAVQFDQPFGDGQAEAGAFVAPLDAGIHLAEQFEHGRHMLLGDADAGIGDGELRQRIGRVTSTVTLPPLGVNFTALARRLMAIWRTARSSAASQTGVPGRIVRSSTPAFSAAAGDTMVSAPSTTSHKSIVRMSRT